MSSANGRGHKELLVLLLTIAITAVVALTSAWALERNSVDEQLTRRVTELEKQYVSIQTYLQTQEALTRAQNEKLDRLLRGLGLEGKP